MAGTPSGGARSSTFKVAVASSTPTVAGGKGASSFSLNQFVNIQEGDEAGAVKDGHYMSQAMQQKIIEQVSYVTCKDVVDMVETYRER